MRWPGAVYDGEAALKKSGRINSSVKEDWIYFETEYAIYSSGSRCMDQRIKRKKLGLFVGLLDHTWPTAQRAAYPKFLQ